MCAEGTVICYFHGSLSSFAMKSGPTVPRDVRVCFAHVVSDVALVWVDSWCVDSHTIFASVVRPSSRA